MAMIANMLRPQGDPKIIETGPSSLCRGSVSQITGMVQHRPWANRALRRAAA